MVDVITINPGTVFAWFMSGMVLRYAVLILLFNIGIRGHPFQPGSRVPEDDPNRNKRTSINAPQSVQFTLDIRVNKMHVSHLNEHLLTCIHDPIYRRLIDEENIDDNQKRTWCIVKYPSSLKIYIYITHIFHLFGPFMINFISSVILIKSKSRQQANLHKQRPYKIILREQFRQHKNLLTAPIVLIILAIPRVIIIFVSKCMKSANDSWLYLVGYFISFIPPMPTSIIFVVPSEFYRKELRKILATYQTYIQQRLHLSAS